jgi:predicted Rossmann fold flavoprotein
MKKDVIIIGAGAAGLMCAVEAGKRGRAVLVLEHAGKIGNKIRISGGGRCNFTNIGTTDGNYVSNNPHFCKSALSRFAPHDIVAMLEKHDIGYHEKEKGQLFLNNNSMDMIHMLKEECDKAGVRIECNCRILEIKKAGLFTLMTSRGLFRSESLVVATGGPSYPETGATVFGHRIAKQFGIRVSPLRPGLVPFTFRQKDLQEFSDLSGISLDVEVGCNGKKFHDNLLFTRLGLSGPAALQISLYWNKGDTIVIDLLPGLDTYEFFMTRQRSRMEMRNLLSGFFPERFSQKWCDLYIRSKPLNQYSVRELEQISLQLRNWQIIPAGTEGYGKAEVTVGGVDTDELSSKTMEAKKVPGLYFVGEVLDVTGQLGGYNLQWAWSSGYAAGQYA